MDSFNCNWIDKGLYVSHSGIRICCEYTLKEKILPSEYWAGNQRQIAKQAVSNKKPVQGCETCYLKESKQVPSTRQFSKKHDKDKIQNTPVLLDLDLSNLCNLKCIMCGPRRSSVWNNNIVSKASKEIIDDVLKISGNVKYLIIQGGEPTIMEEYQYFFDKLDENNYIKNIELQIISNATNVNKKFYKSLEKFKKVRLSVSIDAFGKANDYIRWPSKFNSVEKNLHKLAKLDNNINVEIFNSLNILSMFNYYDFLIWCKDIETHYIHHKKSIKLVPMKVMNPTKFSPFSAPTQLKDLFAKDIEKFFEKHNFSDNKFKTELQLLCRSIKQSKVDHRSLTELLSEIDKLNNERNVSITNYIPHFFDFIKKT